MAKETPFDAEISRLEGEIKAAQEHYIDPLQMALDAQRLQRAEFLCPFKVGDIVVKGRGEKATRARVVRILFSRYYDGYTAFGNQLRKDGTDGRPITLYTWDNWAKE